MNSASPLIAAVLCAAASCAPLRADFSPAYDLNKTPGSDADAPGVLAYGGATSDEFGRVVAAGDLNGDGVDDLIVGTFRADAGSPVRADAGAVYVWFGKGALAGTKDVAAVHGPAPDLTILGASAIDNLTVGGALAVGDLNGDGVADLIVGANLADGPADGRVSAGEAFIVFGRAYPAAFPVTLDLAVQGSGGADVTIYGATANDIAAGALAVGDVNGDGIGDLVVGAVGGDGPAEERTGAGEACVILGRAIFPATLDLAVQGSTGASVTIYGSASGENLTVTGAMLVRDVNGDNVGDLILGGSAGYVVLGRATFPATLDLAVQGAGGASVTISAAGASDALFSGGALAAGDVNGDGLADLILGASRAAGPAEARTDAGEAYLVFGRATFPAALDLAVQGSAGASVTIYGASANDTLTAGGALAVGDVNGDGLGDIVLGASFADGPEELRDRAGEACIVLGRASFPATLDLAVQGAAGADVTIHGASAIDFLSSNGSLALADFNGDGAADIALGAHDADGPAEGRTAAGEACIVLGRKAPAIFPATLDLALQSSAGADVTLYGGSGGSTAAAQDHLTAGGALAAGDVNGDGVADLLLGAYQADGPLPARVAAGEAYVLFGIGPPAPDIAVEQPAGVLVADGGRRHIGTAAVSGAASAAFTIRNTGSLDLTGLTITKDGTDAAMFTLETNPVAPVSAGGSTSFTVQFAPTSGGMKSAVIHIASNDPNENPFDITLTGRALSFADDTDGDGLNDASELELAALGFDWQVNQASLVNTYYAKANGAGLFTISQVQALHIDVPLLVRNPASGQFTLTIGVQKATDLLHFNPFPMTAPQTIINAEGQLEFTFGVPDDAAFFRLEAR